MNRNARRNMAAKLAHTYDVPLAFATRVVKAGLHEEVESIAKTSKAAPSSAFIGAASVLLKAAGR